MDSRSASSKNYYELLGLSQDASTQDIRSNYYELARVYHPDSNFYSDIAAEKVSPEQVELFKIITAAYQTLSDPKRRKEYDQVLAPAVNENIRIWEENDSFWDKQVSQGATTVVSEKRPRAHTFGQTGARPRKATFSRTITREAETEASLKEIIKSQSKKKTKRVFLGAVGVLIGLAAVFSILIFAIPKQKSTQASSPSQQTPQTQNPASWRSNLDG